MSESAKTLIKYFCDRFLDIDYYPTNLKSVLDLDINKLKNINDDDSHKFKRIEIETLRDLSMVDVGNYERLSKKALIDNSTFKNALIAAFLIANAWNKRKSYLKKPKMKVVIAGLDFAGKTSLINRLLNDYNYNDMINLEPTIGANIEEYQSNKLDLILWDLGGQKDHVNEYLESPEKFFIHVDVLIFVFDSQDDIRYDEAVKYLNDILNILTFLNENPYFVILLNKADSDLIDDPDFQIKLEYLMDKISNLFMNNEKSWNFEIIPTSIYNFYSSEPDIAKSIKNIFSKEKNILDSEKILPTIDDKLQRILDVNLKLMDKVVTELTEVRRILFRLTPSDMSQSLFSVPFEKVPLDYVSNDQVLEDKKKKKKVKGKNVISDKRSKKVGGPPKKLKSLEQPTQIQEDEQITERITTDKIKKAKESLSAASDPSKPPIAPRKTTPQTLIKLESLKPPPPPPMLISSKELTIQNQRSQIISELKDIFKKRGLVTR